MTDPLTSFEIHLTDGRVQRIEAEACERQGQHWAFVVTQLVMNRPRTVVRLRVRAAEVREVRPTA